MTFATALVGLAFWQAQVAAANDAAARHKSLPPPVKTKRAVRPPAGNHASGDPVADYAARARKGLTDQEIGWIVEDFKNAGLDLGLRAAPTEDYLTQRKAQDRWFHDALVEAWSLTPEQSAEVTSKLAELFDKAKAEFLAAVNTNPQTFEQNGKHYQIISSDPIHQLISANRRLQPEDDTFLPWNLCTLPHAADHRPKENPDTASGYPDSIVLAEPLHIAPAAPDLVTVDRMMPLFPPPPIPPEEAPNSAAPHEQGILQQLHALHPAQLKLLLLIDPEKAKEIQTELDSTQ